MKKAILVAVLWTAVLSAYGQSAPTITPPIFSPQVFETGKATKTSWLAIPSVKAWRNVVKNASKGQPTWNYMKFDDIGSYLTWGQEHWYKAYYSPDGKLLYRYNSGMTRGQKVTVRVLFPGTYYVYFEEDSTLLRLDVTTTQVMANVYIGK